MNSRSGQPDFASSEAVFNWCLRNGLRMERVGALERAALWAYIAAGTAAEFGHSLLCSASLESFLVRVGRSVTVAAPAATGWKSTGDRRWLHVVSKSFPVGGHTAIARRWIARNPFGSRHSVALTFQPTDRADPGLVAAARRSGGSVHSFADVNSLLRRAAALRRLAWEEADVVVLHIHWWDVVPSLAFAVSGGPPVLLVNHADHAFWVGSAVADIVVDIRDSGLALSRTYRGVRGSAVLPVPLDDRGPAPRDRSTAMSRLRDPSVLTRDFVLLTIGTSHKYRPTPRLDFPQALVRILDAIPESGLIAIGPSPEEPPWVELARRTGGRAVAVGPDPDLAPWHAAADFYLEGFPIGSYTALLETALAERAFVRKPILVAPDALPIDRGALAAFEPPADPDAYVAAVVASAANAPGRDALARQARSAVLVDHCGYGWSAHLDALCRAIPRDHDVGLAFEPQPMPALLSAYWASIHATKERRQPLDYAEQVARREGLQPRFDVALIEAMRKTPA